MESPTPRKITDEELLKTCSKIQENIDLMEEKSKQEQVEIEKKYQKQKEPLWKQLSEMTSKIPQFWLTAFQNHPDLSLILSKKDKDTLKFLTKIETQELPNDNPGDKTFTIHFHFDSNPFFENDCISKTFTCDENGEVSACALSAPIRWHKAKEEKTSARGGRRKRPRPEDDPTFFTWLESPDDMEYLSGVFQEDLCQDPLRYYLNQHLDDDLDDDDDEKDEHRGNGDHDDEEFGFDDEEDD